MPAIGKRISIEVKPGTNPSPDATQSDTLCWIETQLVRFFNGKLRKLAGWLAAEFSNDQTLLGAIRSIFSYRSSNKDRVIIGTNTRKYSYQDGALYNITPLLTSTTAIANSLDSNYITLANNPITTVLGSKTITVANTSTKVRAGDGITLSGVTGNPGGIPNAEINTSFLVRTQATNNFTVAVATTAATSNATAGGASVVLATPIITVNAASHGLSNGDRIKINAAATFAGIPNTDINKEHVIRNVATNTFDIVVDTTATSSVSSGGGASTTYQKQIAKGAINTSLGFGYGGGLYGVGLYGVGKAFVNSFTYPRIWSDGRFGDDLITTPGNGGDVYIWENSTEIAPTKLTNSPAADWIDIYNNAVIVLKDNIIKASAIGDATIWTPDYDNNAYADTIEGANDFISSITLRDDLIIFSEREVHRFSWIGEPDKYDFRDIFQYDGIIGPKARAGIQNAVLWMGQDDFYVFDGSTVARLENNTCREFIYTNLNYTERYKIFCSTVDTFSEVSWDIPMLGSNEPNYRFTYNYREGHFTISPLPGTAARTAGEEKSHIIQTPYMAYGVSETIEGALYRHETGVNDNTTAMESYAISSEAMIGEGDNLMMISKIVPDSTQTGTIDFSIYTRREAQSSIVDEFTGYTIDPTTEMIDVRAKGRLRKYKIEQNALDETFILGKWREQIQEAEPR